jgi:hypothetical protein
MGFLGGSVVILAAIIALAITIANKSTWVVAAAACLAIYTAQFHYLRSIGKYEARQRLQIWQLSLLGHIVLFAAVLWIVGKPSIALVLLLPEVASCLIHLVGMHRAYQESRDQ